MESEWIEWAGGECPVDELVRVECIFRAPPLPQECEPTMPCEAGTLAWWHDRQNDDIVAYRVLS